jgi:hypothetical protein
VNWHWIITLRWVSEHGRDTTNSASGTLTADQAAFLGTRQEAHTAIVAAARRDLRVPAGPVSILFFALEPDTLKAAS